MTTTILYNHSLLKDDNGLDLSELIFMILLQ
jgi:hypothetical protein